MNKENISHQDETEKLKDVIATEPISQEEKAKETKKANTETTIQDEIHSATNIDFLGDDEFDENGLVKITSHYPYCDKYRTLRLPVNFAKLKHVDDAIFAYSILEQKGREKAKYLVKVTNYCEDHNTKVNREMRSQISYLRYLKMIKIQYKLETQQDIINLLSMDKSSLDYEKITENSLVELTPKNVMLGFSKKNNDSRRAFNKLYNLETNETVFAIARAIRQYIDDGYDYPIQLQLMNKYLKEAIDDYHNYPDDNYLINNLSLMLELSDRIIDTRTVKAPSLDLKRYGNVTDAISSLFSGEAELKEFLK